MRPPTPATQPDGEAGPSLAEIVPHRPPILALDRLLERTSQRSASEFLVHPGAEVDDAGSLWEGVMIEGLAQTASALHFSARQEDSGGERRILRGMLVGLRRVRIHRRARVGERIEYAVDLIRELRPFSLVQGSATIAGEVVAEAEMKFYVEEAP